MDNLNEEPRAVERPAASKVLICFCSRYGATAKLAEEIAEGAQMVPPDEVRIRYIRDLDPDDVIRQDEHWWRTHVRLSEIYREPTLEDLMWANAVVLGSPGHFGGMAAAMKHWLERTLSPWNRPDIEEKAGAAFATTATAHGGSEAAIFDMLTALMNLGFIITPSGYVLPTLGSNQCPYGALTVTGRDHELRPMAGELAAARSLGFRVSHVARCLAAGQETESYRRRHWYLLAGPSV